MYFASLLKGFRRQFSTRSRPGFAFKVPTKVAGELIYQVENLSANSEMGLLHLSCKKKVMKWLIVTNKDQIQTDGSQLHISTSLQLLLVPQDIWLSFLIFQNAENLQPLLKCIVSFYN